VLRIRPKEAARTPAAKEQWTILGDIVGRIGGSPFSIHPLLAANFCSAAAVASADVKFLQEFAVQRTRAASAAPQTDFYLFLFVVDQSDSSNEYAHRAWGADVRVSNATRSLS
jgi:hypothetical protein